jgi:hypothetical protein
MSELQVPNQESIMKKFKITFFLIVFTVICLSFLFISCENMLGNEKNEQPKETIIRIGETVASKQISVKVDSIEFVKDDILAICLNITNNRFTSIGYSNIWSWGVLKTPENTQVETVSYIGLDIEEFSGSSILPGVTIVDTITLEKHTYTAGVYTFYANPPLPDDFTAEKMDDFQIEFNYSDIPPKTSIEGTWYLNEYPWGSRTYTFNYNRYIFKGSSSSVTSGVFVIEGDKIIFDNELELAVSYILEEDVLKLKLVTDDDYEIYTKQ